MAQTQETTRPIPERVHQLHRQISAGNVGRCYGCKKCSAGCPVNFETDLPVHQAIRNLQLGQYDPVMASRMIWLCTGCKTCYQRCPNEIDSGHIMDLAKVLALSTGVRAADPRILAFNRSFLDTVRLFGRAYELGMTVLYKLRTRALLDDLVLGIKMLSKGKLALVPAAIKTRDEVGQLFDAARRRSQ